MRRLFLRRLSTAAAAAPPPSRILIQQLHYAARTLQGFCFLHLFWEHFYSVGATSGASMLPTINIEGDFIIISKLYSRGRGVGVGDLVSYVHPVDGPGVHVCKRVIGMPGDFVVMDPMGAPEDMMQVCLFFSLFFSFFLFPFLFCFWEEGGREGGGGWLTVRYCRFPKVTAGPPVIICRIRKTRGITAPCHWRWCAGR